MMNRKKASLMLSGVEAFLMTMIVVLFLTDVISPKVFVALIIVLGIASSGFMAVIVRKFQS